MNWKSRLPSPTIPCRRPTTHPEVLYLRQRQYISSNKNITNIFNSVYVTSNTQFGDYHHPRGFVVTHIVKANIPVRNGVVHLIDKPLVVIDSDIVNFLKVIAMLSSE